MSGSAFRPTRLASVDAFGVDVFGDGVAVPVDGSIDLAALQEAREVLVVVAEPLRRFFSGDVALHLAKLLAKVVPTAGKLVPLFSLGGGLGRAVGAEGGLPATANLFAEPLHFLLDLRLRHLRLRLVDLINAIVLAGLGYVKRVCGIILETP